VWRQGLHPDPHCGKMLGSGPLMWIQNTAWNPFRKDLKKGDIDLKKRSHAKKIIHQDQSAKKWHKKRTRKTPETFGVTKMNAV
jgi:hypothetical protein